MQLLSFLGHHRLLVHLMLIHQVTAKGADIHPCLTLPALHRACLPFLSHVGAIATAVLVGICGEWGRLVI